MRAVGSQDYDKVTKFCTKNDNICIKNIIGNNAIHVAAKVCNPKIFQFLVNQNPTCLNDRTYWTRRTAYELAWTARYSKLLSGCNENYGIQYWVLIKFTRYQKNRKGDGV